MKKLKNVMALLLALSMVLMSGMFAFADVDSLPQDGSISVPETEDTTQPENQQPGEDTNLSDEQGAASETEEAQTPEDNKDENVPEDETANPEETQDPGETETAGEGETPSPNPPTAEGEEPAEEAVKPNYIETRVFLRYDNTVPTEILQSHEKSEYGPAGNGTPYFEVKVDLNKIEELFNQGKIQKYTDSRGYVYYSAQSNPSVPADPENVKACWEAILTAIDNPTERKQFINFFGAGSDGGTNFIGYVFKSEFDGWHIDGILDVIPGYVTEFYLDDMIKNTVVEGEAMTSVAAKSNIEGMLGAVPGTIEWNDNGMGGTFERDNAVYQFTIGTCRPEKAYSPEKENVTYEEKIQQKFYLARIYVGIEKTNQEPTASVYKIEYYKQKADGTYDLFENEFPLYGEIGSTVTAPQKEYEGFVFNADKSKASGEVVALKSRIEEPSYLVLKMYYDIKTPQPPVDPIVPDPVIPVTPPVIPDPVDPQPLPPDDPLIEEPDEPTVNPQPQPLPPDDFLIEEDPKQPLPDDEYLEYPTETEKSADSTDTEKSADPNQPKTGDEAPLMALSVLFFAAAGALSAIYIKRRTQK